MCSGWSVFNKNVKLFETVSRLGPGSVQYIWLNAESMKAEKVEIQYFSYVPLLQPSKSRSGFVDKTDIRPSPGIVQLYRSSSVQNICLFYFDASIPSHVGLSIGLQ